MSVLKKMAILSLSTSCKAKCKTSLFFVLAIDLDLTLSEKMRRTYVDLLPSLINGLVNKLLKKSQFIC